MTTCNMFTEIINKLTNLEERLAKLENTPVSDKVEPWNVLTEERVKHLIDEQVSGAIRDFQDELDIEDRVKEAVQDLDLEYELDLDSKISDAVSDAIDEKAPDHEQQADRILARIAAVIKDA